VSPSNTMSPGPKPTSTPNGILIHRTVWPQYTNVTDRQIDRTDRTGQRSRSIGRTVTCNGRPERNEIQVEEDKLKALLTFLHFFDFGDWSSISVSKSRPNRFVWNIAFRT